MTRNDYRTPAWLFDLLSQDFGPFNFDAAASITNHLCAHYATIDGTYYNHKLYNHSEGLEIGWQTRTFVNPPFSAHGSRGKSASCVHSWIEKAIKEVFFGTQEDKLVCMIVPVGCSQLWFHRAFPRATVYKPDMRISFDNPDGSPTRGANRDSDILLFAGECHAAYAPGEIKTLACRYFLKANGYTKVDGQWRKKTAG